METDKVHTTVKSLQQPYDLTAIDRAVVQSAKTDILERATALVREVVLPQQGHDLGDRHLPLGRHEPAALLRQW